MRLVYERFKNENDFLILSHTCNPETDSASRLKQYADSMKVSTDRWIFLTGRKDSLYYQARLSYHIDDRENNIAPVSGNVGEPTLQENVGVVSDDRIDSGQLVAGEDDASQHERNHILPAKQRVFCLRAGALFAL